MTNYEDVVAFWQKKSIKTEAELAMMLNSQSINFAYNSGKIENDNVTYHDTREVFENGKVINYTGDVRTLFEINNAKDANELLIASFGEKRCLDETLIKDFHYCSTKNTYDEHRWEIGERPGQYKKHDYVTGKNETGALPEDVPEEMDELINELSDIKVDNVIVGAAYFHAKLENIHPFADGNGRVGRLLLNYLLITNNHPPVVIHEENKNEYYKALEAWDNEQELNPLISFLKSQTVKTWERTCNRDKQRINDCR